VNLVEILVTAKDLTGPAMASAKAKVEGVQGGMAGFHKTAALAAAGFAVVGVEAVKMATKFDSEMSLLYTQAGVGKEKIDGLKKGVLGLAGKVGQDPDSLAEALFHVESNFESMGITSEKALKLTETAAKGATVGHADLVDVTNALTAAVAANIPGVENLDQAMGYLNATVGVGDMKMQDLASAFSTGMVATVKGYGLSIQDVGASLAVFGDNNMRGAAAATNLRMSVQALAQPAARGADALASMGLQTDTLAKDMQKGGLKLALEDLVAHMKAAGISSEQQGQIITQAFGKKAGTGLNILVGQMGRLESKYPALEAGAKGFGKAWAETQDTLAFKLKAMEYGFKSLMISIGEKLIPSVSAFVDLLKRHKPVVEGTVISLVALAAAVVAVSTAMKIAAGVKLLTEGMAAASLKMTALRAASISAGGGLAGLKASFVALGTAAKATVIIAGIAAVVAAMHALSESKASIDVDRMATSLMNFGRNGAVTGELASNLGDLSESIAMVSKTASDNKLVAGISNLGSWLGMTSGPSVGKAKENVDALDKSLASLVTSGHADLAAAASTRLQKAWEAGGGSAERYTSTMDDYAAALDGAKTASDLTAEAQGAFGKAAQDTKAKLDIQKQAADGLRESLVALNDTNRKGLNAQSDFEQAIDAATAAITDHRKALSYVHGELDLNSQASRDAYKPLSDLAAATDAAAAAAKDQGKSWQAVDGIYERGRAQLIKTADAMGLTADQANDLADQILLIPDKTVSVTGDVKDLTAKLADAKARLAKAPASKKVAINGEIADLTKKLAAAQRAINALQGKTIDVRTNFITTNTQYGVVAHEGGGYAHGGVVGAAGGGPRSGMTWVGEQGPELVSIPAGSTVHSANQSRQMDMAGNRGGGGPIELVINLDGREVARQLFDPFRSEIRDKGGNVQRALGAN
jgi:TP901 family phage tail tape measure protein